MHSDTKKKRINKLNIVLSILIAFAAWMYVVYNVHPTINKSFRDIPITFTGQYELADRGYAIETAEKSAIDVTLKINRTDISKISENDIEIVADVRNAVEGSNNIQLSISVPNGTSIKSQEAGIITVNVGPVTSKDVKVIAMYSDSSSTAANQDAEQEPYIDKIGYEKISVYGTEANLKKVKYGAVVYDMSSLSETQKESSVDTTAIDSTGKVVPFITTYPSELNVTAHKASIKKVELQVVVKDEATDEIKRSYTAPKTVFIKGQTKDIASITSVMTDEINLNGISRSTQLPLTYVLPDGVTIANRSLGQVLSVTVK